jgi:hypothetical protein
MLHLISSDNAYPADLSFSNIPYEGIAFKGNLLFCWVWNGEDGQAGCGPVKEHRQ